MKLNPDLVKQLAEKYLNGTATREEKDVLHEWYSTVTSEGTEIVIVDIQGEKAEFGEETFAEIKAKIAFNENSAVELAKIRYFRKWVAAAAVAVLLVVGGAFYFYFKPDPKNHTVASITPAKEVQAPQTSRAMITFSNGSHMSLDSVQMGSMINQGNAKLTKMANGQIKYFSGKPSSGKEEFNTLSVPRGSRVVSLTLNDGTTVWLNAESSLTYPVVFTGNQRVVTITGEAYFEVFKNPKQKFVVKSNTLAVEVFGTHFNINTYQDEGASKITLLEGSVKILTKEKGHSTFIKPGEQAQVKNSHEIFVTHDVNLEAVMAWKNEQFMMKGTDLGTLVHQMARWYDIQISLDTSVPNKKFSGSFDRNLNLSTILEALNQNGIRHRTAGERVIIY